jgi:hypothetical protein
VKRAEEMDSHPAFHLITHDVCEAVAHVAQLAEHVLGKDEVTRSIRVVGSMPSLLSRRLV